MQISSIAIHQTLDFISQTSMRNMDAMMQRCCENGNSNLCADVISRCIDAYYRDAVMELLGIELLLIDKPKVVSHIHDLKVELDTYCRVLKTKLFTSLECYVREVEEE